MRPQVEVRKAQFGCSDSGWECSQAYQMNLPELCIFSRLQSNMYKTSGEWKLESERASRFLGIARIELKWLHFALTEVDSKQVQRLRIRFSKDCCRLDPGNHIPAIIDQGDLKSALLVSNLPDRLPKTLRADYPQLTFWPDYRLECLHGRHRLEAAKLALSSQDRWWIVDLYDTSKMEYTSLCTSW